MKPKILFLDDAPQESLTIGLIRLSQDLPSHELFFKINNLNEFYFTRIKDLIIHGQYFLYHFPRFEAYHHLSKNRLQIISNKSEISYQIKEQSELFHAENDVSYIFNELREVDYLIKSADLIDDFSLILLPENSVFSVQSYVLSSDDERFQLINYYE